MKCILTEIQVDEGDKATCLGWTYGNEYLIAGFDSGLLIKYDASTGTCRPFVHYLVHENHARSISTVQHCL